MTANPAPENLYVTQIAALYHPLITLHITVTEQPKFKVANSRLSSLLAPPAPPPPQVAMSEKIEKNSEKTSVFAG